MEKRKFLNLCGKRDRALLSGEKRMTLGDMERLTYLTEFFELENYGIALWKEFGDDLKWKICKGGEAYDCTIHTLLDLLGVRQEIQANQIVHFLK